MTDTFLCLTLFLSLSFSSFLCHQGLKSPKTVEGKVLPRLLDAVKAGAEDGATRAEQQAARRAALSLEALMRHANFFHFPRERHEEATSAIAALKARLQAPANDTPAPWASAVPPVAKGLQDGRAAVLAQAVGGARQATPNVTRLGDGLFAGVVHVGGRPGPIASDALPDAPRHLTRVHAVYVNIPFCAGLPRWGPARKLAPEAKEDAITLASAAGEGRLEDCLLKVCPSADEPMARQGRPVLLRCAASRTAVVCNRSCSPQAAGGDLSELARAQAQVQATAPSAEADDLFD